MDLLWLWRLCAQQRIVESIAQGGICSTTSDSVNVN